MYCNNCGNEVKEGGRFCPSCGSVVETTAREVAPVANLQGGRIQPEAFSEAPEGSRQAPPRETRTGRNSRGHFSSRSSKKGVILVIAGILVLVALGGGGYWWMHRLTPAVTVVSGDDIVIQKETPAPAAPAPAPEKPAEAQTAPAKEKKAAEDPGKLPAQKKVGKKAPAPKPASPGNTPWRYRVETPTPKPAPQAQPRAQASKNQNPLGKLFDVFQGPAPDVTPAPAPNDARGTGM